MAWTVWPSLLRYIIIRHRENTQVLLLPLYLLSPGGASWAVQPRGCLFLLVPECLLQRCCVAIAQHLLRFYF